MKKKWKKELHGNRLLCRMESYQIKNTKKGVAVFLTSLLIVKTKETNKNNFNKYIKIGDEKTWKIYIKK